MEHRCSLMLTFLHQSILDHWVITILSNVDFACVSVKNYSSWTLAAIANNNLWNNTKDKRKYSNWLLINTHTTKWLSVIVFTMFLNFHMLSVYNKRLELGEEEGKIRNSGIPMIVAEIKGLMSKENVCMWWILRSLKLSLKFLWGIHFNYSFKIFTD